MTGSSWITVQRSGHCKSPQKFGRPQILLMASPFGFDCRQAQSNAIRSHKKDLQSQRGFQELTSTPVQSAAEATAEALPAETEISEKATQKLDPLAGDRSTYIEK